MSDLPFRQSCRGLVLAGERILLAEQKIGAAGTVWVVAELVQDLLADELFQLAGTVDAVSYTHLTLPTILLV